MPIYEYRCDDCGRSSEALQRIADPPLTECAHCGGRLQKQVSAPAFQFKGSGWYVTDYARKGGGGGGESAAKDDASGSSKGDSGGEQGGDGAGAKKETAKPAAETSSKASAGD